jgi:hypothetical protein
VGADAGAAPVAPFQVFAEAGCRAGEAGAFAAGTLTHVWASGDVSRSTAMFTSPRNAEALQQGIRYRVYVESGGRHVIGRQSDAELAVVMRSVLLQSARNADDGGDLAAALAQVRALNAEVLAFCVPRILHELRAYEHYLDDISTLPVPLERGQIASTKGERSLQLKAFV